LGSLRLSGDEARGRRSDPPSSKSLWRAAGRGQRSSPGRACFKRPKRPKRPKPMFAGFFAILKRPKASQWDALKSEFGSMFTGLGTLGRLRFFGVVLRADFLTTDSRISRMNENGSQIWSDLLRWLNQKSEVGGHRCQRAHNLNYP
jgi:hypothetical protein